MKRVLLLSPFGAGKRSRMMQLVEDLPIPSAEDAVALTWMYYYLDVPIVRAPMRVPHHTVSETGMLGGSVGRWRVAPGEVSLAHAGVLVLEDLPEFRLSVIRMLACALRDGCVHIWRRSAGQCEVAATFPARPEYLVATATLCPCGLRGDHLQGGQRGCDCSRGQAERWIDRITRYCELLEIERVEAVKPGGAVWC